MDQLEVKYRVLIHSISPGLPSSIHKANSFITLSRWGVSLDGEGRIRDWLQRFDVPAK